MCIMFVYIYIYGFMYICVYIIIGPQSHYRMRQPCDNFLITLRLKASDLVTKAKKEMILLTILAIGQRPVANYCFSRKEVFDTVSIRYLLANKMVASRLPTGHRPVANNFMITLSGWSQRGRKRSLA